MTMQISAPAAPIPSSITLNTGAQTLTDMPLALSEFAGAASRRLKCDLTNATQARITLRCNTAGVAAAVVAIQYSLDESTWNYLDAASGPSAAIATNGTKASAWIVITAAARADVFVRIVTSGGDGAADPVVADVALQAR